MGTGSSSTTKTTRTKIATMSFGFPGVTRVFTEMEKVGASRHNRGWGWDVPPEEYEVVVLGAWEPDYDLFMERHPKPKYVVLWTSPVLQTEFSLRELQNFLRVKYLAEKGRIRSVWFADGDWLSLGLPSFSASYPVTMRDIPEGVEVKKGNVDMYGPMDPRKNVLCQLLACRVAKKGYLHFNAIARELLDFVSSLGLEYFVHPWMLVDEYFKSVASMELGLQVSVPGVESFSYVAFDHLMMDRPCLSSVDWIPKELSVTDTHPELIGSRMNSIPEYGKGWWRKIAETVSKERTERFKSEFEFAIDRIK